MTHWVRQLCAAMFCLAASLVYSAAPPLKSEADWAAARQHWAYQPIRAVIPPQVRHPESVQSPVDAFIVGKLAERGLGLSELADRRTLIRRAYYDLIGLPPTLEEIRAFEDDGAPDAFAKVVEHLLTLPQYGECWARHWLDVARYAETKDLVLLYGKDRLRPFAYTYRDYVIRAFNEDTPFDRFVVEQIAADQIRPKVDSWRLAALGFLTLGRLYDNNRNDQIDDQIDTVTRGFLGLTVSCARCHDHKYDAIPTADYYSLYGVFASSEVPYNLPLIEDPRRVRDGAAFEKQWADALRKLSEHIDSQYHVLLEDTRQRVSQYLARVATSAPDFSETATFFLSLAPDDLRPALVTRWRRYLERHGKLDDGVFGLWAGLMALPDADFSAAANRFITAHEGEGAPAARAPGISNGAGANGALDTGLQRRWNPLVLAAFKTRTPTNKTEVAQIYGEVLVAAYERAKHNSACGGGGGLRAGNEEDAALVEIMTSAEGPVSFPRSQTPQHMSRAEKDMYGTLVTQLDKLAAYATNRPPARAMAVMDAPELYQPHIFVRGSPARIGDAVPRAFLTVLAGKKRSPFEHGSGRIDLARAIASPENPLTARVFVNRVWMEHFGEPLVSSLSDFGTRSSPPTHPELLDYLAGEFIRHGWSLKWLHRTMMLSRTYQQSSSERGAGRQADPENRWLWRANRRRLDLESMRDTLLFVSGRLDLTMGGPPVDVAHDSANGRRTVYGLVDRQDLPALFRAFDFASPDQSAERRSRTTVPQQALFAMNSAFVLEQAKGLAARALATAETEEARVDQLYGLALARRPSAEERAAALGFIKAAEADAAGVAGQSGKDRVTAWEQFGQVLLMTNELMFID